MSLVRIAVAASLAALALAVAAGAAPTAATVPVTMKEWGFATTAPKVKAGKVTFVVKNNGKLKHEFLVLKTNTAGAKLPVKGTTAVVTGLQGKLSQFAGGKTEKLTLTLKPGHYVLICNLPAHYKLGQHVDLTVS